MRKVLFFIVTSLAGLSFLIQSEKEDSIKRGEDIYIGFCQNCHLPSGEGVDDVYPPLSGADYLQENLTASIRAVKYGMEGEIEVNGITYNNYMASQGLSDAEVADVMNYILNTWDNKTDTLITEEHVAQVSREP